ncbi:hypothetical protein U5884_003674 [Vibrio parahaemolyticus]|nr:hypothetical protein [Vibrio parahaemolyticus]EMA9661575.1 hypothetical protein [Vibrio parahaemolyticus]MBM5107865.1 hypothetical protein [Vibrio parahaemolyticus]
MDNFFELSLNNRRASMVQILDIPNPKARNLLRGINDLSSYSDTRVALLKIKEKCSNRDYYTSLKVLRSNDYFEKNIVGRDFPKVCLKTIPEVISIPNEELISQFNLYSESLEELCLKSHEIVSSISKNEFRTAILKCEEMAKLKGISLFLIRTLIYLHNRVQSLDLNDLGLSDKVEKLLQKIEIGRIGFLESVIRELSNLRTDYFSIRKKIERLNDEHPHHIIAKSYISHIPRSKEEFEKVLYSYYSFSLLDAFFYYERMQLIGLPFVDLKPNTNTSLREAYGYLTSAEFLPENMYTDIDGGTSHSYLRECFLISEQLKAFEFKTVHDNYYTDTTSKPLLLPYEKKLIQQYFLSVSSLLDLRITGFESSKMSVNLACYDRNTCGYLENSSALLNYLEKCDAYLSDEDETKFVELMSSTRDIGEICNKDYLQRLATSASLPSLRLVISCLISIKDKSSIAEYDLRSVIQDICKNEFNGQLNELIQHLYSISPAVCEHLILTCDETFIRKLFHIMEKPIEAIRARADMLHWFGEITGDDTYIDRAKNLRIDIQISKEKGTIDDSRIYVDPLKYTQWISDNILNELTLLLDGLSSSNLLFTLNWNESSTGIKTVDSIMSKLLECYDVFCRNNMFGIASYLGRRIRHGTFKGTGLTEVKSLASRDEYSHLFEDIEFKNYFDHWVTEYGAMIDELVKSYLHIRSKKKPQGYISTEIDTKTKRFHADQMFIDVVNSYEKYNSIAEIPYLIAEHCWRLVEVDLVSIRKLLMENKSNYAVFKYRPKGHSTLNRLEIHKFSQEINNTTADKFRTISSWFTKPSYASPSTDLHVLFRAVTSEVKESIDTFDPDVHLPEVQYTIAGGVYFVIYDTLYVLIYNAAKHGKRKGKLSFNVTPLELNDTINISVSSEVESEQEFIKAHENIEKYMSLFSEDANIFEGKSGIKKLKRLEREGSISNLNFRGEQHTLRLSFSFDFKTTARGK